MIKIAYRPCKKTHEVGVQVNTIFRPMALTYLSYVNRTKYHRRGDLKNRYLFSIVREDGKSKIRMLECSSSSCRLSSWSECSCLLRASSDREKALVTLFVLTMAKFHHLM